jgi:ribosomal protein L40E
MAKKDDEKEQETWICQNCGEKNPCDEELCQSCGAYRREPDYDAIADEED